MILLDTDHLSVLTDRRAAEHAALVRRLEKAGEPLGIWLAKLHRTRAIHLQITPYERLAALFEFLADWDIIRLSEAAADVVVELRRQRIRIGSQDLKIAAMALAENALLLSANLRDFQKAPGLRVENWLQV